MQRNSKRRVAKLRVASSVSCSFEFFSQRSSSKIESASSLMLHRGLTVCVYLQEDVMCNPIISCLACCHKHSVVCVLAERLVRNKSQFLISLYNNMCIIKKAAGEDRKV